MDQNVRDMVEAYKKAYEAVAGRGPEGSDEQLAERIAAKVPPAAKPAPAGVTSVAQAEALAKAEAEQWQRQVAGTAGPGTNNPAAGQPVAKEAPAMAGRAREKSA